MADDPQGDELMATSKQARARALFEDFTGHAGEPVATVNLPADDVLVLVGNCEAIAYNTVRDGKRERYVHEFRSKSRPVLAVSHDGERLYLLAGAYKFTHRGIEDR
jgi:hypothetical protein